MCFIRRLELTGQFEINQTELMNGMGIWMCDSTRDIWAYVEYLL